MSTAQAHYVVMSAGTPIVTGEAVVVELRPAGVGSRGIALLVDVVAQFVLALGVTWLVASVGSSLESAGADAVVLTFFVLLVLGYPVGFETLWRGRTPGKAVMGLRVLRDDGGPIRFRHAFVRGLVGVVVDRPGLSAGLLALVPMLATKRSKRLGDLAAGTVVVQERVPARVLPPPMMPPPLAGWAAALDLSGIDDDLASELRQFLARSPQLAPWARQQIGDRLLAEVTRRIAPPPPGTPPWAYLSAVLAERRRREIERLTPAITTPPYAEVPPGPEPPPTARPPETPPGPFAPPA